MHFAQGLNILANKKGLYQYIQTNAVLTREMKSAFIKFS